MGLKKTNYSVKTVGHLNILDAFQTGEENITGLEKRLGTTPLQAEGKASPPKMPWTWGTGTAQAYSSCLLLGTVMSKQVTAAFKRQWVSVMKEFCPLWEKKALANAIFTEAFFPERKEKNQE